MSESLKCHTCKYMVMIAKKSDHYDNAISYPFGYVCTLPYSRFQGNPFLFMDTDQGGCEMHTDAWMGSMTPERYRELTEPRSYNYMQDLFDMNDSIPEPELTEDEQKEWCFCESYDGLLVHKSQIEYENCSNNCKAKEQG